MKTIKFLNDALILSTFGFFSCVLVLFLVTAMIINQAHLLRNRISGAFNSINLGVAYKL
jgi:hypothetical protein